MSDTRVNSAALGGTSKTGGDPGSFSAGASLDAPAAAVAVEKFPRRLRQRDRASLDGRFERLLACVHCDAQERERAIFAVAHRLDAVSVAAEIGALRTGDAIHEATKGATLEDLSAWLDEGVEAGEPRTLVVAATIEEMASRGGLAPQLLKSDDAEIKAITARLVASSSQIVVALTFRGARSRLLEDLPEAYVVPWLHHWLKMLRLRFPDISSREIEAKFGRYLEVLCIDRSSDGREPELELFLLLEEIFDPNGEAATGGVFEAVKSAIDRARTGRTDRSRLANESIERIFDEGSNVESGGEIGRTLFAIEVFAPDLTYAEIQWLCRQLLPRREVPLDTLPKVMRERWNRDVEESRRLRLPGPRAPTFADVFEHDPDRHLAAAGLQIGPGGLDRAPALRQIDAAAFLAGRFPGFLSALYARIGTSRLYAIRHQERRFCVVALHLALARALNRTRSRADLEEIALTIAGMHAGDEDFRIDGLVPDGILEAIVVAGGFVPSTLAHIAQATAALERLEKASGNDGSGARTLSQDLTNLSVTYRFEAARVLDAAVTALADRLRLTGETEPLIDAILLTLARVLAHESFIVFLGFHLLYGRGSSGDGFGRADLAPAAAGSRPDQSAIERRRKEIFGKVVEAADKGLALSAARVRSGHHAHAGHDFAYAIERWPDALRALAQGRNLQVDLPVGVLATFAEDHFTQYSISWNVLATIEPPPAALGLRQLLHVALDGPEPILIERLFVREPRRWLEDLASYEAYAAGGAYAAKTLPEKRPFRIEAHVHNRLGDVYAVLVGRLGEDARSERAVLPDWERLETVVWSTLSDALKVGGVRNLVGARDGVLTAFAREAMGAVSGSALDFLGLYPLAVFAHWRFLILGTLPIREGADGYLRQLALLQRLRRAVTASGRRTTVAAGFAALAAAQARLAAEFSDYGFAETATRCREKAGVLAGLARFFAPAPVRAVAMPSQGTDASAPFRSP